MKKFYKKLLSVFLALMMVLPSMAVMQGIGQSPEIVAYAATKKVSVSKPTKFSVKAKVSNSLDVSFKKVNKASGYIIYYSTSKKFTKKTTKKIKIKVTKKNSKKKTFTKRIKKLKNNKKYYVRVRAYRTVNKKTYYSKYTKTKAVKAKKITKKVEATTAAQTVTQPAATQPTTAVTPTVPVTQPTTTQPVSDMPEKLPVSVTETTAPAGVTVVNGYIPESPANLPVEYSEDDSTYSKGEWVALLVEKANIPTEIDSSFGYSYSDIAGNEYADIIQAAYNYGILPESADAEYDAENDVPTFKPTDTATREFAAYTIAHAAGFDTQQTVNLVCNDADSITYKTEVAIAIQGNFMSTDESNNFNPSTPMTGTDKNHIFAKLDNLEAAKNIDTSTMYQNIVYSDKAEGSASTNYTVVDNGNETATVTVPVSAGNFVVGDVVVLPANDTYPNGYPIKITGVSISNGVYTLTTVTPELNEVFSTIQFQGLASPDLNNIQFADGVEGSVIDTSTIDSSELNSASDSELSIHSPTVNKNINPGDIVFEPENAAINCNIDGINIKLSIPKITARVNADVGWFGVNINEFMVVATEELQIKGELASVEIEKSQKLGVIPFSAFGVASINVEVYANFSLDGSITVEYVLELENGLQYVNGMRNVIKEEPNEVKKELTIQANAKIGLKVSVSLYLLSIFNIVGFYGESGFAADAYIKVQANHSPTLTCADAKIYLYLTIGLLDDCLVCEILSCFTSNTSSDIWDSDNSPIKWHGHYEICGTGPCTKVDECTYGQGYFEGKVVNSSGAGISGATVNVYTAEGDVHLENVVTSSNGTFKTKSLPFGRYRLVISATRYARYNSTEEISNRGANNLQVYKMTSKNANATGIVEGTIKNAETGNTINNVTYTIYKNWNNTNSSDVVSSGTANGNYSVELPVGYYTISFSAEGHTSNCVNATVLEDACTTANVVLNTYNPELEGTLRVVLTWGETPSDLDSHLYATSSTNSYHVYYNNSNGYNNGVKVSNLDVDDTTSYGPETVTIYEVDENAKYQYFVHNYSNRGSSSSTVLSNSGATIKIYDGNVCVATFHVPADKGGTVWHVFDYDAATNTITPVNEMYYQSSPASVNISSN